VDALEAVVLTTGRVRIRSLGQARLALPSTLSSGVRYLAVRAGQRFFGELVLELVENDRVIAIAFLFALDGHGLTHSYLFCSVLSDAACAKVVVGTESASGSVEACGVGSTSAALRHEVALAHPDISLNVEGSHQVTSGAHARRKGISSNEAIIPASESVLGVFLSQLLNPFLLVLLGTIAVTEAAHPQWRGGIEGPDEDSEWPPYTEYQIDGHSQDSQSTDMRGENRQEYGHNDLCASASRVTIPTTLPNFLVVKAANKHVEDYEEREHRYLENGSQEDDDSWRVNSVAEPAGVRQEILKESNCTVVIVTDAATSPAVFLTAPDTVSFVAEHTLLGELVKISTGNVSVVRLGAVSTRSSPSNIILLTDEGLSDALVFHQVLSVFQTCSLTTRADGSLVTLFYCLSKLRVRLPTIVLHFCLVRLARREVKVTRVILGVFLL
jgi:hypothetical protein